MIEPEFNEEDLQDSIMDELPTGGKKLPLQKEQQDSCDQLNRFFYDAWPHGY